MNNAALYLLTILIWGSTWLAIEFQLGVVPPEVSVVYRYSAASALLFLWCLVRGIRLRYPLGAHLRFAGLGFLLFGVGYAIAYRAQIYITGAMTAVVFSTLLWLNRRPAEEATA